MDTYVFTQSTVRPLCVHCVFYTVQCTPAVKTPDFWAIARGSLVGRVKSQTQKSFTSQDRVLGEKVEAARRSGESLGRPPMTQNPIVF